jgi:hypothetical protein
MMKNKEPDIFDEKALIRKVVDQRLKKRRSIEAIAIECGISRDHVLKILNGPVQ